jgi:hypothetical protein
MKKHILLVLAFIVLIGQTCLAQSKSVDSVFQKYKGDENFFHLDLGGSFMNFAKGMNIQLENGLEETIANSMERMKMFKLPLDSQIAKSEYKALQMGLEKERFDLTMELNEKKNEISVYTKGHSKISNIVVLLKDDKGEVMVFELLGEFDPKVVSDIGKSTK